VASVLDQPRIAVSEVTTSCKSVARNLSLDAVNVFTLGACRLRALQKQPTFFLRLFAVGEVADVAVNDLRENRNRPALTGWPQRKNS
jgi:hypothetical protein